MNIWQRKLLAFLHDPPEKALDIPGHTERRMTYVRNAGFVLDEDIEWYEKNADRFAAAADRFPFPTFSESGLASPFGGAEHPFRHPTGGSCESIGAPATPDVLAEILQKLQHYAQRIPDEVQGEDRDRLNFFLHWRRWAVDGAKADSRIAFLPADTRIPDHTIWHHNGIASALQGTWNPETGNLEPAFLVFQCGGVQDFIEQARSTRDLWSGSYLLSWLMAHAMKAVSDAVGPDSIVFPFLRAVPLFDLLHRDAIYSKVTYAGENGKEDTLWARLQAHERDMLVPNLPNRFLALVPAARAGELAEAAEKAFRSELRTIATKCWSWFGTQNHPLNDAWRSRYDDQIEAFPQIVWQTLPWTPGSNGAWRAAQEEVERLLAARRNTRDFEPWLPGDNDKAGTLKDSLSGKEEVVGNESWWKAVREHGRLKHLFRSDDKLGAVNLVKRVWHRAYLEDKKAGWGLDVRKAVDFDSVPDVAAGAWRHEVSSRLNDKIREDRKAYDLIIDATRVIAANAEAWGLGSVDAPAEKDVDRWIARTRPEVFMESAWKDRAGKTCDEVLRALHNLYSRPSDRSEPILQRPPRYVAVIAMDGDEMGKWMSGEKSPPLFGQFSEEAQKFYKNKPEEKAQRSLSPSFHAQFSEALGNFAVYLARPVIKAFGGQLIYAGGDDVLCMVPAEMAISCAAALREAFRGQSRLETCVPDTFEVRGEHGGWVRLTKPKGEQPTWPLLVPGPNTDVSAGIAIGHCNAPLQGLIRAAQSAEKRAKAKCPKGYARSAFAVSLFKRSGEIVEWGANWDSGALPLYERFVELTRAGKLTGKFAHALEELIAPYRPASTAIGDLADFPKWEVLDRELARVLERQADKTKAPRAQTAAEFREVWEPYKAELKEKSRDPLVELPGLFRVANFILRGERE